MIDEVKLEELVERVVRRVLKEQSGADLEESLGKEEVAKLLGVTSRTITTYMRREGIPHTHRAGRARFSRTDVLAWWRSFDRRPTRKAG